MGRVSANSLHRGCDMLAALINEATYLFNKYLHSTYYFKPIILHLILTTTL